MGQIIASSLDSLVGYEDCDPSITGDSFLQVLQGEFKNLFPPPSKGLTYIFVSLVWLITTIILWILRSEIGKEVVIYLTVLPIFTFLFGVVMDIASGWKDKMYASSGWLKKKLNLKSGTEDLGRKWKGKWGFIYGLGPYIGYYLYVFLKYWILRVKTA